MTLGLYRCLAPPIQQSIIATAGEAMSMDYRRHVVPTIVICAAILLLACAGCISETVTDERGTTRRYYRPSILEFFQWDGFVHFHFGKKITNDAP